MADRWRYRVEWVPVAGDVVTSLPGTWLVVVPAGQGSGSWASAVREVLAAAADDAVVVTAGGDRGELAARLMEAGPVARGWSCWQANQDQSRERDLSRCWRLGWAGSGPAA